MDLSLGVSGLCQSYRRARRLASRISGGRGRAMVDLRQEGPADYWEVEALYDLCFAPGREALSSYRLRDGVNPVAGLCLVAREDGIVSGAALKAFLNQTPSETSPSRCGVVARG